MNVFQRCYLILIAVSFLSSCGALSLLEQQKRALMDEEPIALGDAHDDEVLGDVIEGRVTVQKSEITQLEISKAVKSYEQLLQQTTSKPVRSEALRRLADLTMRLAEQKEIELLDGKTEAELDADIRNATYEKALALYSQLLEENPNYYDISNVKYQMAKAHQLAGKGTESLQVLDAIAENYPENAQIAETHFRRGEIYFNGKQYRKALIAYKKVITDFPDSPFYRQSIYKHGWSLYKANDFDLALIDFFDLLEILLSDRKSGDVSPLTRDLTADTYRVISLSFFQLEGSESIKDWFREKGEKAYEYEVYQALANLMLKKEQYESAAQTYAAYIEEHPFDRRSPALQTRIIEVYNQGGFPSLILPAKEAFAKNYGRSSEFWQRSDENTRQELLPFLKQHLTDVSSFYHAKAQKSKKAQDYRVAASWYREYISTFPKGPDTARIHYLLAEALFDGKFYTEALAQFEKIAYDLEAHPRRSEAAYSSLVTYQEIIKQQPKTPPQRKSEWEQKFVVASKKFSQSFPTEKNAASVLSNAVELQLTLGNLQGALVTSRLLLTQQPNTTAVMRQRAQAVVANGEFDLGNFVAAEKEIDKMLSDPNLKPKDRENFIARQAQAIYKQGELAKKEGKLQEAINHYLRVPPSKVSPETRKSAQFDAATLLLDTKQWQPAINVLANFRGSYPKDPLQQFVPEKLFKAYEALELWPQAASELKRIADREKKGSEVQSAAYWQVAELYEKAKQPQNAIAAYKFYARNVLKPVEQNVEAKYKLVNLYIQQKEISKSDFWRRDLIKMYQKLGKKSPERLRFVAAESDIYFAQGLLRQYKSIRLTQPIKNSLARKQKSMQALLKAYGRILDYGVAKFRTQTSYQIAEIYTDLAKSILQSQRPKGLDADALEEYEFVLEERAFPFEENAIEAHVKNIENTQLEIYDDWVKKSFKDLKTIQPARYDKPENKVPYAESVY
ncbi:MAG: tetratricopeptide repeat protein [Pseudomonadota bacterium]